MVYAIKVALGLWLAHVASAEDVLVAGGEADDECDADVQGAEGCGLQLRQLRGELVSAAAHAHEQVEENLGNAFCCFASSNVKDICGSCYDNAHATSGKEWHNTFYCTKSNDTCVDCGGIWCKGQMTGQGAEQKAAVAESAEAEIAPAGDEVALQQLEVETETGGCAWMKREYFCTGTTRIHCCKRGFTFYQCGSVERHQSCLHLQQYDVLPLPSEDEVAPSLQQLVADTESGGCAWMKREYFCTGTTRIHCCKRGFTFYQCGSVTRHKSCLHLQQEQVALVPNQEQMPGDTDSLQQLEVDAEGGGCAWMKREYFCTGTTRIHCCKRGFTFYQCGSVERHQSCLHLQQYDVLPLPSQDEAAPSLQQLVADTESGGCAWMKREYFCTGTTRIHCCKRGLTFYQCGSATRHSSCLHLQQEEVASLPNQEQMIGDAGSLQQLEVDTEGGGCAWMKRQFYCSGTTRIQCCKRGLTFYECGSVKRHESCMH